VFELDSGKLKLIEIAPGVELEKDILAKMEFEPVISDELKEMDVNIFR
jgi:propionate CoA-transferase